MLETRHINALNSWKKCKKKKKINEELRTFVILEFWLRTCGLGILWTGRAGGRVSCMVPGVAGLFARKITGCPPPPPAAELWNKENALQLVAVKETKTWSRHSTAKTKKRAKKRRRFLFFFKQKPLTKCFWEFTILQGGRGHWAVYYNSPQSFF